MSHVRTWGKWALWLLTAAAVPSLSAALAPTRILVKPKAGMRRAELEQIYAQRGCRVYREYPEVGSLQVIEVAPPLTIEAQIDHFRASKLFEYVEPDRIVQGTYMPNDPALNNGTLWNLYNTGLNGGSVDADIDAPEAWDIQSDASGIIVAVIDSGVRYSHQDLNGNMWRNWGETPGNGRDDDGNGYVDDRFGINAIANSGNPMDAHGHGTHIAGIIGAVPDNGVGCAGVALHVQIMALKFQDAELYGVVSDAIECVDYARRHGARIINASWADAVDYNSDALRDAIAAARDAGIIFVTAANNQAQNNDDIPMYPGAFRLENMIVVAATNPNDELADWSNYGYHTVDLAAPGQTVYSTWAASDSAYRSFSGTSMAAPHVAGACALVWARFPWLNYREVIDRILSTVDPLPSLNGRTVTGGRLNVRRALSEVNSAPSIAGIADRTVVWGTTITMTASASDPENNELRFGLEGAPAGATINQWTGQFSWTPTEAQAPGNYVITVRVTDDGSPPASATTSFRIIVGEPNAAPTIAGIPDRTVVWGTVITAIASASDPDNNELRFSLEGAPSGATINEGTGQFSWTPTEAQAPGNYVITVRVTDNGSPPASATTTFTVVVVEHVRIASIRQAIPGEVVLTWNSSTGAEYRVEYADVPGAVWQNHSSITAQGIETSVFDNTTGARRFYRVVRTR